VPNALTRRRLILTATPLAALALATFGPRSAVRVAAQTTPAFAVGAPTWAANAAVAYPGPGRQQVGDKEVVVSLWQQRLWAYEGEVPVLSTLVSTGTAETYEVSTPIGQWRISVKFPMETMAGTVNGESYRVEDVPDVMYFTNEGHAIHGAYWHSNFGTPMSHGCVNLPLDVADWMFGWAPEGTGVTVIP